MEMLGTSTDGYNFPPLQTSLYPRIPLIESTTLAKSNIYVGNLPLSFTTESLMSLFSTFGYILRCKVGVNRTGKNAGYGFVQFDNDESASKAIAALDGYSIGENVITVSVASGRSKRAPRPKTNVYFSGLPHTFSTSDLIAMCDRFGRIIGSRVLVNPVTNQSRGYGFVRFDTHENAIKAIAGLNGTIPPNGVEPLVVKFAREPTDPQHPSQRKLLRETFQAEGVPGSSGVWVKSSPGLPLPQREASDDQISARFSQLALNSMAPPLYRVPDYYQNSPYPSFPLHLYNQIPYPPGTIGLPADPSLGFSSTPVAQPLTIGKDSKTMPAASSTLSSVSASTTTSTGSLTPTSIPATNSTVVSVSGFPVKIKKQELDALFASYGKIISSRYLSDDESKAGLGKGTVRFETHTEALRAIAGLNDATRFGKDPLKVTLAQTNSKSKDISLSKTPSPDPKTESGSASLPSQSASLSHYPLPSYVYPYQYSPSVQYRYLPTPPSSSGVYASISDYKYSMPMTSVTPRIQSPTNPRSMGTGTYSTYSHGEYTGYQVVDPRTGFPPSYPMGFSSNPIYVPQGTTSGSYYPPGYQTSGTPVSGTMNAITTSMNSASFVQTTVSPVNTTTTKSLSSNTTTTTTTPYFPSRPSDFYYSSAYR